MNMAALEAIMESLFICETCAYTGSFFEYLLLRTNSLSPCVYSVFHLLLLLSKHFHVKAFLLLYLHVLCPRGAEKSINKSFREAGCKFCQAIDTLCPWEPCLVRGDNAKLLKSLALLWQLCEGDNLLLRLCNLMDIPWLKVADCSMMGSTQGDQQMTVKSVSFWGEPTHVTQYW